MSASLSFAARGVSTVQGGTWAAMTVRKIALRASGSVNNGPVGYTRARWRRRILDRIAAILKRKGVTVDAALDASKEEEE